MEKTTSMKIPITIGNQHKRAPVKSSVQARDKRNESRPNWTTSSTARWTVAQVRRHRYTKIRNAADEQNRFARRNRRRKGPWNSRTTVTTVSSARNRKNENSGRQSSRMLKAIVVARFMILAADVTTGFGRTVCINTEGQSPARCKTLRKLFLQVFARQAWAQRRNWRGSSRNPPHFATISAHRPQVRRDFQRCRD